MDALIGILSLLGIVVALVAAGTGMQRLNASMHPSPLENEERRSWLGDVAKSSVKVILITASIGGVLFAAFVGLALAPISNKEALAGGVGILGILGVAAYLKAKLRQLPSRQPWEHPSAEHRRDEPPQK